MISQLKFHYFLSPEWVFDCNVAVHSNSQQTKDGALSEHEDEASDEQAAVEICTETSTENITDSKRVFITTNPAKKKQQYIVTDLVVKDAGNTKFVSFPN